MEQIKIGTIAQGAKYKQQLTEYVKYGFETFQLNWHMELGGADLAEMAKDCEQILADSGKTITTLGLYCNPPFRKSQICYRQCASFRRDHCGHLCGRFGGRAG